MRSDLKVFLWKAGILFCLTLLPTLIGKLLIPLDWYSFRCWETLINPDTCALPGEKKSFFYPNSFCSRVEEGDLGAHSRYAVKKQVEWHTDSFGFRNKNDTSGKRYPIVVVGDSDIVGTSLTDEETITSMLQKLTGANSYAWAPRNMNDFLNSERFKQTPPSLVVAAENERNIPLWPAMLMLYKNQTLIQTLIKNTRVSKKMSAGCSLYEKFPERWQHYWSDVLKKPFLIPHLANIFWSYLFSAGSKNSFLSADGKTLFFKYAFDIILEIKQKSPDHLKKIAETIIIYKQILAQRNMSLIYMPIPAKESILWDKISAKLQDNPRPPTHLSQLTHLLESQGIPTVDLTPIFRHEIIVNKKQLYQTDDCHLNAEGAKIAAYLLAKKIQQLRKL